VVGIFGKNPAAKAEELMTGRRVTPRRVTVPW
jgi:hypothetical protein